MGPRYRSGPAIPALRNRSPSGDSRTGRSRLPRHRWRNVAAKGTASEHAEPSGEAAPDESPAIPATDRRRRRRAARRIAAARVRRRRSATTRSASSCTRTTRYRELFGLDLDSELRGDLRKVLPADVLVAHFSAFSRARREHRPVSFDIVRDKGRKALTIEVAQLPDDWSDGPCLLGVVARRLRVQADRGAPRTPRASRPAHRAPQPGHAPRRARRLARPRALPRDAAPGRAGPHRPRPLQDRQRQPRAAGRRRAVRGGRPAGRAGAAHRRLGSRAWAATSSLWSATRCTTRTTC